MKTYLERPPAVRAAQFTGVDDSVRWLVGMIGPKSWTISSGERGICQLEMILRDDSPLVAESPVIVKIDQYFVLDRNNVVSVMGEEEFCRKYEEKK